MMYIDVIKMVSRLIQYKEINTPHFVQPVLGCQENCTPSVIANAVKCPTSQTLTVYHLSLQLFYSQAITRPIIFNEELKISLPMELIYFMAVAKSE